MWLGSATHQRAHTHEPPTAKIHSNEDKSLYCYNQLNAGQQKRTIKLVVKENIRTAFVSLSLSHTHTHTHTRYPYLLRRYTPDSTSCIVHDLSKQTSSTCIRRHPNKSPDDCCFCYHKYKPRYIRRKHSFAIRIWVTRSAPNTKHNREKKKKNQELNKRN